MYIPCINCSPEPCFLPKHQIIGNINIVDYSSGPDVIREKTPTPKIDFKLDHLVSEKKNQMLKLLHQNIDIFSKDRNDLGRMKLCEHEIKILTDERIRRYPRRKSPEARRLEDELIQQMLEGDVIRPSISPYSFDQNGRRFNTFLHRF